MTFTTPPRCPNCRAVPPAAAHFCPQCGLPFETEGDPVYGLAPPPTPVDVPFRTAIKAGAGLAIGAALVIVAVWSSLTGLFALSLAIANR